MKSEKARELIEKYAIGNSRDAAPSLLKRTAIRCVELAEQEAEERILNKVHKTFMEMMTGLFHGEMPRTLAGEFIQKLTEDETD